MAHEGLVSKYDEPIPPPKSGLAQDDHSLEKCWRRSQGCWSTCRSVQLPSKFAFLPGPFSITASFLPGPVSIPAFDSPRAFRFPSSILPGPFSIPVSIPVSILDSRFDSPENHGKTTDFEWFWWVIAHDFWLKTKHFEWVWWVIVHDF